MVMMIIVVVDEIVLVVDIMFLMIVLICSDMEMVVIEIDELEFGFDSVNWKLVML